MKTDDKGLVIREILIFEFLFLERWIGINERRDEQFVGANVIYGSKKINVRANVWPKKIAESFSIDSLKESLLNTQFNHGSRHRTIVKCSI
jgi:hypothetical protein